MKYLIAGLGNTGDEYKHTRHNIGFDAADRLASLHGAEFTQDRLVFSAGFRLKGKSVFIIRPTTFMNLSGKAVLYWMQKFAIPMENLLVITDDLSLALGKIRIRPSGSDGGHNGIKSINMHLGTDAYPRLRFGIGNDFPRGGQVDFVLGSWGEEEKIRVNEQLETTVKAVESFILSGIAITMNQYNR